MESLSLAASINVMVVQLNPLVWRQQFLTWWFSGIVKFGSINKCDGGSVESFSMAASVFDLVVQWNPTF